MDERAWTWRDAEVLWAEIPVDVAVASAMAPPGMRLAAPAMATVFVADYPTTTFGSAYREAAVLLHGQDERGPFLHCPWMVVDDDTALILGREMLGFPKKLAEIDLEVRGERAVGTVVRRGSEVLRIEADLSSGGAVPGPLFDRRFVNVIGSPVMGLSLVEVPAAGEQLHHWRTGAAKVHLGMGDRDPLALLAPPVEVQGWAAVLDFADVGGGAGNRGDAATPPIVGRIDDEAWIASRWFSRVL